MTKLLTPNFKTYLARQFVKSFVGRDNGFVSESLSRYVNDLYVLPNYVEDLYITLDNTNYETVDVGYFYVFAGVPTAWSTTVPPTPVSSIQGYHYDVYNNMKFGKRVTASDISYMISRYDWVANTVYAKYDHTDPLLDKKNFYVLVEEGDTYYVFKCLDNNNGSPSTHKPSAYEYLMSKSSLVNVSTAVSPDNYYYKTSDDYIWMYMYSIPRLSFEKFQTVDYIPLPRYTTELPPPIGGLESIIVTAPGAYHITHNTGTISRAKVSGDNLVYWLSLETGADMFNYPNFYTDSAIYITDGTGAGQLRKIVSSIIVGAERQIIIESPFTVELDSTSKFEIAPAVTITGDGSGAIARSVINSADQLQQIELISTGIGYSEATVTITGNCGYYNTTGGFVTTQTLGTATAIIAPPHGHGRDLINELYADKVCISVDFIEDQHPILPYAEYGLLLDPLFKTIQVTSSSTTISGFQIGEIALQKETAAFGIVSSIDTTTGTITLVNVRGSFSSSYNIVGYTTSTIITPTVINNDTNTFTIDELVDNSGEVLLIKNDALTSRDTAQTERIKLLVDF